MTNIFEVIKLSKLKSIEDFIHYYKGNRSKGHIRTIIFNSNSDWLKAYRYYKKFKKLLEEKGQYIQLNTNIWEHITEIKILKPLDLFNYFFSPIYENYTITILDNNLKKVFYYD